MKSVKETNFNFPNQEAVYHGKVRDVYNISNRYLVMMATDRISAFDHVLPKAIPYKGQVLNQIAAYFLNATKDIVPNWLEMVPHPNVSIGKYCTPFKIEMVVRGYLSGHAWREYKSGKREICGVSMPEGMKENDAFPKPIITPTTKVDDGHDEDISREEIIKLAIVSKSDYEKLEAYSLALFEKGTAMAKENGLILVDTKYEFGKSDGNIILIDEIHTPDSSRYFYLDTYEGLQQKGEKQKQLSKEFVREWLIENGFQGLEGQRIPEMSTALVNSISERYIELYEKITAQKFQKANTAQINSIEEEVLKALNTLI